MTKQNEQNTTSSFLSDVFALLGPTLEKIHLEKQQPAQTINKQPASNTSAAQDTRTVSEKLARLEELEKLEKWQKFEADNQWRKDLQDSTAKRKAEEEALKAAKDLRCARDEASRWRSKYKKSR